MPYILSVNAGSSSLKISLYEVCKTEGENPVTLILSSSITSISSPPAVVSLKHVDAKGGEENLDVSGQPVETITSHEAAFSHFLTLLNRSTLPTEKITHVCHRVVHGGDFGDPIEIGKEEFERIERLSDLAPL
jgi:acetate kinase